MRKIIRIIFALIFGFVAFEVVELWPVRPMWSLTGSYLTPIGFSNDDQDLFAIVGLRQGGPYQSGTKMQFVRYDARTGGPRATTNLSIDADFRGLDYSASADCSKLLFFGLNAHRDGNNNVFQCFLFDTQTGQCLGGPWECGDQKDIVLSPDGRWIHKPWFRNSLISTSDGRVTELPSSPLGQYGSHCRFSEDSSKLALLSSTQHEKYLHILAVPSGENLGSYYLPNEGWGRIQHWHGDTITLSHHFSSEQAFRQGSQSFRLSDKNAIKLGSEPLLQTESSADRQTLAMVQADSVIRLSIRKDAWPNSLITFLEWCDKHFKTEWCWKLPERTTFRIFDRKTEKQRLDFAIGQYRTLRISHSGYFLATVEGYQESVLSIWNINPFPRWPWALGASFSTFIFVFFFPRLRSRTKAAPVVLP